VTTGRRTESIIANTALCKASYAYALLKFGEQDVLLALPMDPLKYAWAERSEDDEDGRLLDNFVKLRPISGRFDLTSANKSFPLHKFNVNGNIRYRLVLVTCGIEALLAPCDSIGLYTLMIDDSLIHVCGVGRLKTRDMSH